MTSDAIRNPIELATELTIAWLGNQNVRAGADEVPAFLRSMHGVIADLGGHAASGDTGAASAVGDQEKGSATPAVSIRKSLASPDFILSLIDGRPYKTLRRHLARHGLTPEQYRERYKLKPDYPMVAPAYSEARRAVAHQIGLGARGRAARSNAAEEPVRAEPTPARKATRRRTTAPKG